MFWFILNWTLFFAQLFVPLQEMKVNTDLTNINKLELVSKKQFFSDFNIQNNGERHIKSLLTC